MADAAQKFSREKLVVHALGVVASAVSWDDQAQDALTVIHDHGAQAAGKLGEVARQIVAARPHVDMPPVSGMDWAMAMVDAQRLLAGYHYRAMGQAFGGGA
jgi:hypothetical protein